MGWRLKDRCKRRCYKKLQHHRWEEQSAASRSSDDVGYRTNDEQVIKLLDLFDDFEAYRTKTIAAEESNFSTFFTEKKVNPLHLWMGKMQTERPLLPIKPDDPWRSQWQVPGFHDDVKQERLDKYLNDFFDRPIVLFDFLLQLEDQEIKQFWDYVPDWMEKLLVKIPKVKDRADTKTVAPMMFRDDELHNYRSVSDQSPRSSSAAPELSQSPLSAASGADAQHSRQRTSVWGDEQPNINDEDDTSSSRECCHLCNCYKRLWKTHRTSLLGCLGVLCASLYIFFWLNYIQGMSSECCSPKIDYQHWRTDPGQPEGLVREDTERGAEHAINPGLGPNTHMDVSQCVSQRKRPGMTEQQLDFAKRKDTLSVLTPDQSCPATCDSGYFPKYVLRRASEPRTKAEFYTCRHAKNSRYTYWDHRPSATSKSAQAEVIEPFECVNPNGLSPTEPTPLSGGGLLRVNQKAQTGDVHEPNVQVWYTMTVSQDMVYEITVKIDDDRNAVKVGYISDSVLCMYE
eukprot:COSAG01_NODE_11999_length_1818_cov_10.509017_1_plen_512_part_01